MAGLLPTQNDFQITLSVWKNACAGPIIRLVVLVDALFFVIASLRLCAFA